MTDFWRVEVFEREPHPIAVAPDISVGDTPATLEASGVYYLQGPLDESAIRTICERLLCDPVTQVYEARHSGGDQRLTGPQDRRQNAECSRQQIEERNSTLSPQSSTLSPESSSLSPDIPSVEIIPKPGVMDPVALSTEQAVRRMGYPVERVRTARRYVWCGAGDLQQLETVARRQLANTLIERVYCSGFGTRSEIADPFVESATRPLAVRTVPLLEADDQQLLRLSDDGHLFLNLEEIQAIREHYRRLGREPTDVELETLAQTWSEHCVHKTLKSRIRYRGAGYPERIRLAPADRQRAVKHDSVPSPQSSVLTPESPVLSPESSVLSPPPSQDSQQKAEGGRSDLGQLERTYENLLSDTIAQATRELDKSWCLSVFVDNAGIIEFDERHGVAFKVETHNHPSALEPYGGAATGIGGCIRDILGCGLGARPIANTDVFCFADPQLPQERVPTGLIHPARSLREVVRGVRDYGNRMGIPTVNGALAFDDRYLGNPLVYCGCVGIVPRDRIDKSARQGDRIVLIGGRTGRDGIHGATFSSGGMTDTHVDEFSHAVQIGNAITEKKVMDVLLQARDHPHGCLYNAVTDCGAGGLSSAVGEMGSVLGARVHLDRVPLKYDGLRYDEIWISEAQERMVLAVPPENVAAVVELCAAEDVEATDIGEFTADGRLVLDYDGQVVGELNMDFLHNGLPARSREATWQPAEPAEPVDRAPLDWADVEQALLERLAQPNIASKEWIIRQYDHEVQGGSVVKPLMGPQGGPCDGAVVRPIASSRRGVALSCGLCPHLSDVDPYVMAVAAVDEAVRNNICVGGQLDRMAVLDNFCWAGVSRPEDLGALVRAAQGCHDAALAYGVPFISGKDSLNNEFRIRPEEAECMNWPETLAIPGTLLISAISVVQDVARCRTSDLKEPTNRLLLVQPQGDRITDFAKTARCVCDWLTNFDGVRSCHDVGEGGVLVAAAEMVVGSCGGAKLDLPGFAEAEAPAALFAERLGCYLLEVRCDLVERIAHDDVRVTALGTVEATEHLCVDLGRGRVLDWPAGRLRQAWRRTFDWK